MQIKKLYSVSIIILFLFSSSLLVLPSSSKEDSVPTWNGNWSHKQELFLPISTEDKSARFQPIDIKVSFNQKCWAKNEIDHSIRVVCWDGNIWHELECQIYDLEFSSNDCIKTCGLIFLIPEIANGLERYFIFYDEAKKTSPNYKDHVSIEDCYYYYEPISGVLAEGDYYKIIDDGYCVYGVSQKGKFVNRKLSQCIISQKPGNKNFNVLNAYHIASFSFGYQTGSKDEDEISSEENLISKEILTDGNLMVEFGIVSESANSQIRTTNVYKYYYCPDDNKRIYVHVKHEIFEDCTVKGIENADGRYGTLMSYKSKSERLHRMRFGEILPYLHVSGENNDILEYEMNLNPENNEREWIVPYTYDCDIGEKAWFSYDNGIGGISHAIIFNSNEGLVKSGTDEADGIQIKVAEKEYLDVIGAEIDYAAISFGRNSYELGGEHDLEIPDDLVIEFDAEVFTSENGYDEVEKEAEFFQTLIKYRKNGNDDLLEGDKKIYTLTVTPRFSARFFSHPLLRNLTGIKISEIRGELYQDDKLISVAYTNKPFLGPPNIKFPKIGKGEYVIKIFRRFFNYSQKYIGVKSILIEEDTDISVYCTWQKDISIRCYDQNGNGINQIKFDLLMENTTVSENITDASGVIRLSAPFNLFESYKIEGLYKGFLIYDQENPMFQKNINIDLDLYDLIVKIKDKLSLVPAVDVRPHLTSSEMFISEEIIPEEIGDGVYIFKDLISGNYVFQISYGSFKDSKNIEILESDVSMDVEFSAEYDLSIELFDLRGNSINHDGKTIKISRNDKTVCKNYDSTQTLSLPPGEYKIDVYSNGKHIGIKNFKLTANKNIKIVTSVKSITPMLITALVITFIIEIFVFLIFKKISLNTFLKLIAMSLILLSLFQPWWVLDATSSNPVAEKNTEMFIEPQTMIETLSYKNVNYFDLATIPELFTDFIGVLMLVICSGFVLLGISFIPNIVLKRRFYKILVFSSVLFLILVAIAFTFGMSRICELSVGGLQGSGKLDVILPDGQNAVMNANWGLGLGFYLCITAAIIAMIAGIIDSFSKKEWYKRLKKHYSVFQLLFNFNNRS